MFSNVLKKLGGKDNKPNSLEERIKTVGQPIPVQPKFGNTDKPVEPTTSNSNSNNLSFKPKPLEQKHTLNSSTQLSSSTISVSSSTAVEEEVATIFSEGDNATSVSALSSHIKEHSGKVEARVWFMLMDLYQITEERNEFDKTALAFAQLFGTSPPSWFGALPGEKKELGGGKNMIIFEAVFKNNYQEKFKEFLKAARKEKFCRINVSQCKFEQNSIEVLEKILKLFVDLRKAQVASVLMGDNNLINFCKNYINSKTDKKNLKPEFVEQEQLLWLIYLELLQWKGQQEEFETLALEYAEKFEISPPGWEETGVMDLSSLHKDTSDDVETLELEKNLNINNVNPLLDWIKVKFDKKQNVEVDFSNIERVDFSAAGAISFHIQELCSNPEHQSKTVTLKFPNELIIVLLEMVGASAFVNIVSRIRK